MVEELIKLLRFSYDEQAAYLQEKYGLAVCNYFATEECKTKSSKISRMDKSKNGEIWGELREYLDQPFDDEDRLIVSCMKESIKF